MWYSFNLDKAFKPILAFSALIASLTVAYYFLFFLPKQERVRLELQQQEQQEKALKVKQEQESAASQAAENEALRSKCLAQAQSSYNADKVAFCREAKAVYVMQFAQARCGTEDPVDATLCQILTGEIQGREQGCELGGTKGDEIKRRYSAAKDSCYRAYPSK